jgi:hypothetical protein
MCVVPCRAQTGSPWKRFADIPRPVYGPTTVLLDNKIHVLGGSEMDQNKFFEIDRMPRVRCCAGGAVIDGKLYITAGFYDTTGERCPETWGYSFQDAGSSPRGGK